MRENTRMPRLVAAYTDYNNDPARRLQATDDYLTSRLLAAYQPPGTTPMLGNLIAWGVLGAFVAGFWWWIASLVLAGWRTQ